ncbi:hypothetical protein HX099_09330 [Thiopseudomonas alkaliphila]|uniref:Uncharacterized protein n=1 Tax=Thiopseudomonas alkaliphila TaxID=1697053 RepID=A0AAW7DTE1_9GAMM|nr:hypothetical protein [Thiopseudomonas alkaliphila]MDM1696856.1 hypothetical protein [Thiopseudomonas alkaliphila]
MEANAGAKVAVAQLRQEYAAIRLIELDLFRVGILETIRLALLLETRTVRPYQLTSIKKPVLATALSALLIFELSGCGTLIYPERRGQSSGRIDPSVAILNGIGLLFWVVPGLMAFAIDFATGAIYLPSGRYSVAPEQLQRAIQEGRAH